jgi:hypothetical protein
MCYIIFIIVLFPDTVVFSRISRSVSKMWIVDLMNCFMSHRKNISRKLDIHSTAGLTIYAVVNGIVEL